MTRDERITIRENDYGHLLNFRLKGVDGNAYAIPTGATVTFECYLAGATSMFITNTANVTVVSATEGRVRYTVQSADFGTTSAGTYWARVKVNYVTSDEVKIVVVDEYGGAS